MAAPSRHDLLEALTKFHKSRVGIMRTHPNPIASLGQGTMGVTERKAVVNFPNTRFQSDLSRHPPHASQMSRHNCSRIWGCWICWICWVSLVGLWNKPPRAVRICHAPLICNSAATLKTPYPIDASRRQPTSGFHCGAKCFEGLIDLLRYMAF